MANLISYTLKLTDLFSAPLRKAAAVGGQAIGKVEQVVASVQNKFAGMGSAAVSATSKISSGSSRATTSLTSLEIKLNTLTKERSLSMNINDIRRANRAIEETENRMQRLQNMGRSGGGGGGGVLSGLVGGLGGLAAAYGGQQLIGGIVESTSEYEKFQAVLSNSLGSTKAANTALGQLQEMAQKTPFSLTELTKSYVQLTARGFQPTMKEMLRMGDIASSVGKPFAQLSEALLDAQTGEFERLKEFGIKASKIKGTNLADLTFKGQTQRIELTEKAMKSYIMTIGQLPGVSGTMASISNTLGGKISNLGDTWDQLKVKMGLKMEPVFDFAINSLSKLISLVSRGTDFIERHSTAFGILGGVIVTVGAGILAYTAYARTAALVTGGWAAAVALYEIVTIAAATATGGWATVMAVLNAIMMLNPIGLVVAAVIALVAAVVYAWNKFEGFRGFLYGFGASVMQLFQGLGNVIAGAFTINPAQLARGIAQLTTLTQRYRDGYAKGVQSFRGPGPRKPTPDELLPGGGGGAGAASAGDVGLSKAKGKSGGATGAGRGVTNITINIQQLGQTTIHSSSVSEGTQQQKESVRTALLSVLNDANAMTTAG